MAIDAESLHNSMSKLLNSLPRKDTINNVFIPRIPASIKDQHAELYKPQMVAIGPYHDHKEVKFQETESHKHRYLTEFLDRNENANLQSYINGMIALNEQRPPRKCYNNVSETVINDTDFLKMMILDGCFILELVLKQNGNQNHGLCSAGWDFMTLLSDLLLIENQIPFFVLEELYATFKGPGSNSIQLEPDLKSLVVKNLFPYLGYTSVLSNWEKEPWNPTVIHLLNLYHEFSLLNTKARNSNGTVTEEGKKQKDHKLPLIIPSATPLSEFGFKLVKQSSRHNCDAAIYHSTLKIPQLILDSARMAILTNLLEFEQGLDDNNRKRRWTGLMVLMNCLVKDKSDLEILRRNRIVINLLPNEDNAIEFFNQVGKYIAVDFSDHYYLDLVEEINEKCDHSFRKKRAAFMHEYFKNPWALMSFVCSICAITLSVVQTLVSVFTYRHRFL